MSRIAVAGLGYVGLTTAASLADLGNEVVGIDIDAGRIRELKRLRMPFYEPGLKEIVERNLKPGRLDFTTDYGVALKGAEFVFIAVATPEGEGGEADVSAVAAAAGAIADHMAGPLVVVNKSTVPIGTAELVGDVIAQRNPAHRCDVVSNPEFLREGSALLDFMRPDRVVIGAATRAVGERVAALYAPLGAPTLITDVHSAEMVKYASNAFLATKISFINEMARIAERVGADVKVVAEGMGLDRRIGAHYLDAGIGYGGSCFPKDVKALRAIADRYGYHPGLLSAVIDINNDQRRLVVEAVADGVGELGGAVVALWGLAFKPNTDDMREAPSIEIARELTSRGAAVRAYDPAAGRRAREVLPEVAQAANPYAAARGADAVVLVTEWNEFRQLDLGRVKRAMRRPVLVDGRNIYDPDAVRALGFWYRGVGRN